jgi:hypothetical protein
MLREEREILEKGENRIQINGEWFRWDEKEEKLKKIF